MAKVISRDADLILGLFSPFRHEIREYEKYDVTQFRDNLRFLEILAGREGGGGNVCPLFFDGAVNYFKELPLPDDQEGMQQAYRMLDRIRNKGIMLMAISKKSFIKIIKKRIARVINYITFAES